MKPPRWSSAQVHGLPIALWGLKLPTIPIAIWAAERSDDVLLACALATTAPPLLLAVSLLLERRRLIVIPILCTTPLFCDHIVRLCVAEILAGRTSSGIAIAAAMTAFTVSLLGLAALPAEASTRTD